MVDIANDKLKKSKEKLQRFYNSLKSLKA